MLEKLTQLNHLLQILSASKSLSLKFYQRSNNSESTQWTLTGNYRLMSKIKSCLALLKITAELKCHQNSHHQSQIWSIVIQDPDQLSLKILNKASALSRDIKSPFRFQPRKLKYFTDLLYGYYPMEVKHRLYQNSIYLTVLNHLQYMDVYEGLLLAEKELLPLLGNLTVEISYAAKIVSTLIKIDRIIYATIDSEQQYNSQLDQQIPLMTKIIMNLLYQLKMSDHSFESAVKIAAAAYQRLMMISFRSYDYHLIPTILLNAILAHFNHPCILLGSPIELADLDSLYHQALQHIESYPCYLENLISAKLIGLKASRPKPLTMQTCIAVEAAYHFKPTRNIAVQEQYKMVVKRLHLKILMNDIQRLIRQQARSDNKVLDSALNGKTPQSHNISLIKSCA